MNELNRAVALLIAHLLDEGRTMTDDERAELLALAQLANERGEASRGYHLRPRGQAALARAMGSPIVVQQPELIAPSRRKNANNQT